MKYYANINKMKSRAFCILLIVFCSYNLSAQVRFGGVTPPVTGALLELNGDDGTATKGVLLPRVMLMSLDNLNDIIPTATERPDPIEHIGLTVYTVANDANCSTIDPGVYTWTGEQWARMGKELSELQRVIETNYSNLVYDTDQDGNTIVANTFGDAGVWMIHNLAVTKYADGTPIDVFSSGGTTTVAYTYPNATTGNWAQKPSTYYQQQGLLYDWYAATNSYSVAVDQQQATLLGATPGANEVEMIGVYGTPPNMYVQGICPNGWHIPSDREWTQLAKVLYESPELYSIYTASEGTWNTAWEVLNDGDTAYRTSTDVSAFGSGNVAKDMCKLIRTDETMANTGGASLKLKAGGLNMSFTGMMPYNSGVGGNIEYFGRIGFVWASSADANYAYFRSFARNRSGIHKNFSDKEDFMSVRCKKN